MASLLTVVGGFTEFGYNLGNLGRICINIRGNDHLQAVERQGNTDDGTINRVQHYSNRISQMKLTHVLNKRKV